MRCDHYLFVVGYGQIVRSLRNLVKSKRVLSIDLMLRGWLGYGNPMSAMGIWESEKTFAFFTKRP